jgi:hypothetical protein
MWDDTVLTEPSLHGFSDVLILARRDHYKRRNGNDRLDVELVDEVDDL